MVGAPFGATIHTQLRLHLLKSRDAGIIELARRGQTVERPIDLMKDEADPTLEGLKE